MYDDHFMVVTREAFMKWSNKLPKKMMSICQLEHAIRMAPLQVFAMPFMRDPVYVPGDGVVEAK